MFSFRIGLHPGLEEPSLVPGFGFPNSGFCLTFCMLPYRFEVEVPVPLAAGLEEEGHEPRPIQVWPDAGEPLPWDDEDEDC